MNWGTLSLAAGTEAPPASCYTPWVGLTFRNGGRYPSVREDILISLAGSVTQIVLLGIPAYVITHNNPLLFFTSYGWYVFLWDLMWVSLGWGIINLLPILPLDGGNIAVTL